MTVDILGTLSVGEETHQRLFNIEQHDVIYILEKPLRLQNRGGIRGG